jgi:hypothetical protein
MRSRGAGRRAHQFRHAGPSVRNFNRQTLGIDPGDDRRRPLAIREAARRVKHDVKAVHGDIHALLDTGILRKIEKNLVIFPFDAMRVDVFCVRRESSQH